jgi:glycosyltransferase involved in cell wall biosynthesis
MPPLSRSLHWLSPGNPNQRTGGYLYNARIIVELRELGWQVKVHALPGTWPIPDRGSLPQVANILCAIPTSATIIADGLLWTGLEEQRNPIVDNHRVTVLIHSLLDQENQENQEIKDNWRELETKALAEAQAWIATSPATARILCDRLDRHPIRGAVVYPGTDPAKKALGSDGTQLLCVATVTPRKAIRQLIAALPALANRKWNLDIVGSTDRDSRYVSEVKADIDATGLENRIHLRGELAGPVLEAAYQQADFLVHAARFEAFGMCIAEAIARGLPVISTPAGIMELLPRSAYKLVGSDDIDALTEAIKKLLDHRVEQRRMKAAAATIQLPTWKDAAASFESALETLL